MKHHTYYNKAKIKYEIHQGEKNHTVEMSDMNEFRNAN